MLAGTRQPCRHRHLYLPNCRRRAGDERRAAAAVGPIGDAAGVRAPPAASDRTPHRHPSVIKVQSSSAAATQGMFVCRCGTRLHSLSTIRSIEQRSAARVLGRQRSQWDVDLRPPPPFPRRHELTPPHPNARCRRFGLRVIIPRPEHRASTGVPRQRPTRPDDRTLNNTPASTRARARDRPAPADIARRDRSGGSGRTLPDE